MDNKNSSEQTKELEFAPVGKLLVKLSIPAMVGTFVTSLYNIVDRMFLGHYIGEVGIAATTVAFPIMMMIMAVGMLIAFGSNSQLSIKLGEKNYEEADRLLGQGWFLLIASSLTITVFSITFMEPLLRFFGASDSIMDAAKTYTTIVMLGSVSHEISFAANNFVRGEGNAKFAMITMIIGGVINIVLDYTFIAIFQWGMAGAAWATVIGYTVSAMWVYSYYLRGKSVVKLKWKNFKIHKDLILRVLEMGCPNFVMNIIGSLQAALFNNLLVQHGGSGGDTAVATMGVIVSFNFIWTMPVIGMSQGMQPIVGYNYGAKRFDRVKRALYLSYATVTVMCTLFFIWAQVFPESIFKMFVGNSSDGADRIMTMGPNALRTIMLFLPIIGFIILTSNYFQFTGKPMRSLTLNLLRQVGFVIPTLLIAPRYLGLAGVWYALPVSDFGALMVTIYLYIGELARLRKLISEQRNDEESQQQ